MDVAVARDGGPAVRRNQASCSSLHWHAGPWMWVTQPTPSTTRRGAQAQPQKSLSRLDSPPLTRQSSSFTEIAGSSPFFGGHDPRLQRPGYASCTTLPSQSFGRLASSRRRHQQGNQRPVFSDRLDVSILQESRPEPLSPRGDDAYNSFSWTFISLGSRSWSLTEVFSHVTVITYIS